MNIAVVYQSTIGSAWCVSEGIVSTLRSMGHQVLDMPQSGYRLDSVSWWTRLNEINYGDLLIISGADYAYWQRRFGGYHTETACPDYSGTLAKIKPPKFAMYFESRGMWPDLAQDFPWLANAFDHSFYPAVQDAEELDLQFPGKCHWLPFSADTNVFFPRGIARQFELGFIGHVYPERQTFLDEYYKLIPSNDFAPIIGHATVEDIEGVNIPDSTQRMAYNLNRLKVLVCLPTKAQEMVTKIYEGMACGCCVLAPYLQGAAAKNMQGIEHGRDLLFYNPTPRGLLEMVRVVKSDPALVEQIGFNAAITVMREHTMQKRMEFLLSKR